MVEKKTKVTRRKFLRGGAVAAGAGVATLAAPNLAIAAPKVL